jgi:lipoprotein-anchoring transpeptidase ErfK/SrfK
MWYSRKYDMSPMPNSIFFLGGYAIHGTGYVNGLGRPASHGCVRLAPGNAAALFNLVRGRMGSTRITIS